MTSSKSSEISSLFLTLTYSKGCVQISLRWASNLGSEHNAARRRSSRACSYRSTAAMRSQQPSTDICLPCRSSAANRPHVAAVVHWRDRRTPWYVSTGIHPVSARKQLFPLSLHPPPLALQVGLFPWPSLLSFITSLPLEAGPLKSS